MSLLAEAGRYSDSANHAFVLTGSSDKFAVLSLKCATSKPDQFEIIFDIVKPFGRRKNLAIDTMERRRVTGG